jgi:hypothetical protein
MVDNFRQDFPFPRPYSRNDREVLRKSMQIGKFSDTFFAANSYRCFSEPLDGAKGIKRIG